jgi:SAM-dependent methyltransferase
MKCPDPIHHSPPRQLFRRGEIDFRVCPECGLAFRGDFPTRAQLDEIYSLAYSSESIVGGATNQESGDYALQAYLRHLCRTVLRPGIRVLDFGAATGSLVRLLRDDAGHCDGFEFSPAARRYCAQEHGIGLLGELGEIPHDSYDLITMIEVIEHLTDLPATLHCLHAALRPGGKLFLTTPNRKGWRARLEGGNWREARKKFHLFLFDEGSLRHHLRAAGFDLIEQIRFSPIPKSGRLTWLVGRGAQLLGVGGTLCFMASRSRQADR